MDSDTRVVGGSGASPGMLGSLGAAAPNAGLSQPASSTSPGNRNVYPGPARHTDSANIHVYHSANTFTNDDRFDTYAKATHSDQHQGRAREYAHAASTHEYTAAQSYTNVSRQHHSERPTYG